jgi:hypothetical protein
MQNVCSIPGGSVVEGGLGIEECNVKADVKMDVTWHRKVAIGMP